MTIIDRFEGAWAIVEFGETTFHFPKALLPSEAKSGDVLHFRVEIDSEETTSRRRRIAELENRLFRR